MVFAACPAEPSFVEFTIRVLKISCFRYSQGLVPPWLLVSASREVNYGGESTPRGDGCC